jgi:hypothetical protein
LNFGSNSGIVYMSGKDAPKKNFMEINSSCETDAYKACQESLVLV